MDLEKTHRFICSFIVCGVLVSAFAAPASAQVATKLCYPHQMEDIAAVSNQIQARWERLEADLEERLDKNIKGCMKRRFQGRDGVGDKPGNGTVVCVQNSPPSDSKEHGNWIGNRTICEGAGNGFGLTTNKTILLCPAFLNRMENGKDFQKAANRRACYASLLVHEFWHSCFRNLTLDESKNSTARIVERVTFRFWRDVVKANAPNAVTIDKAEECFQ